MDREKILFCRQLWEQAEAVRGLLNKLSEEPEDLPALDAVTEGFQKLQPHLSKDLTDRIVYLFSGAEIEPEDLRDAGRRIGEELSASVSGVLTEQLSACRQVERADAEALFPLWDAICHQDVSSYQWIFDLCLKAGVSMPLEAFQYTIKTFEEQPRLLSGENSAHPGYTYRPSEQHVFERCPICGGTGVPYFCALAYRMSDFAYPHLPVKLWMKCGTCGDLYTWKYPEELLKPSGSRGEVFPEPGNRLSAVESTNAGILSVWSDILRRLSGYSGGKTLLEVGIGKGELLAVALELGYRPEAVEIVPGLARKTADVLGIPIWCGDFLDYAPEKTYSIITMGDVIEHVTDPERALKNAYALLEPEGVLWLSTPNYESAFSRMMKFQDPMWLEPYHISYFSRRGLEALAGKCGFVLREYHVSKRYNGSMELIFTKKPAGREDGV